MLQTFSTPTHLLILLDTGKISYQKPQNNAVFFSNYKFLVFIFYLLFTILVFMSRFLVFDFILYSNEFGSRLNLVKQLKTMQVATKM